VTTACLDGSSSTPDRAPAAERLVGIARLAALSPLTQEKRDTEYFALPVRSVLNRCDSARMPFEWTINPYRGCEFGCRYCYARYTHEFMELDGNDFEKKIFVKQNAAALLEKNLDEESARISSFFGKPEQIVIGAATDPYQPAERDFGVTRALLEKLAEREGLDLGITTKSDQIVRDIDVLQRISARSALTINVSITTPRTRLARLLEPRAPRPDLRFEAVRKLREAGLHAGVFVMPILPGLTDRESDLEILARLAHEAKAEWFAGAVLWLMPASRKALFPFIDEKFPKLARGYRKWYAQNTYAPQHYREEIALRVSRVRARYRLANRPWFHAPLAETTGAAPHSLLPQRTPQLALALRAVS
jgi:DNA repair photolyase